MDIAMLIGAVVLGTGALALVALSVRGKRQDADIRQTWAALATPRNDSAVFSSGMIANLPDPVQRYFRHAIAPGIPLASLAELSMTGTIKLGNTWHPFEAEQVIAPPRGFVWKPRVQMGKLTIRGADRYINGSGATQFRMPGHIPIVQASGSDVAKSALGRMAIESIWLPAMFLPQRGAAWEAQDEEHIRVTVTMQGEPMTLMLHIDDDGRLKEIWMQRWNSDQKTYAPFGAAVEEEQTFSGYTVPSRLNIGWWYGSERYTTEGEFFRCSVHRMRFR
jgi:hypothetical protein